METLMKKPTHPRDIEIHIISAKALRSRFTFPPLRHLRTYAVAWIDPNNKTRTKPDLIGGSNPVWDHKFTFTAVGQEDVIVNVEIYAVGVLFKDRLIGAAQLSVASKMMRSPAEFSLPSALVLRRLSSPWSSRGVVKVGVSSKSCESDVATANNEKVVGGGGSTWVVPPFRRRFSALSISTTRVSSSLIVNGQASSSYL